MNVTVLTGPGLVADPDLVEKLAGREFRALGVHGRVAAAGSVPALGRLIGAADAGALVVLPGPDPEARRLMTLHGPHTPRTVWLDLHRTGPLPVAGGAAHLHGRGLWGLTWAVRHAVHRLRRPARRIPYGLHPDQWGELRLPGGMGERVPPVTVLIHGGNWRSPWGADTMDALCVDLADRGFAAWNLEYRRPDVHGWAATTSDVRAGLAALDRFPAQLQRVDLRRVVVLGHSAGGQLALRVAAEAPETVTLAVSLAGVFDLAEQDRRHYGNGAVRDALGGGHAELPGLYAAADPLARLPLGVPQVVVQGADDEPDLVDAGRRYARAAGREAVYLEGPGDHFDVIDPASHLWLDTAEQIVKSLG
ncbi:hypothetical protein Misp01_60850 [Microtetraspora sp. NBRC 13810]|uniref:alpha/beta hydrolase n=1 Tax=Microtetraspora sp. NBRC 13810 TaxID=3030990 RepID=UPI0024A24BC7|nr:alpha/beta hydrolase [Microtetraspora sp. NBRC 13810]GLW10957.1 hypothetical protein Misp01_60850 [Microtetraspora sp. NBRC 13810]